MASAKCVLLCFVLLSVRLGGSVHAAFGIIFSAHDIGIQVKMLLRTMDAWRTCCIYLNGKENQAKNHRRLLRVRTCADERAIEVQGR